MGTVIGLPAIPGFASGNWRLERSQDEAVNPFGRTRQRTEFDGYVWRCALGCPKYNNEDAAVVEAWLDQVSEADNWLYVSPPQNDLRGAWATPELVSNGTFEGGVTTGWAGTGATLSVNARRLKVKNSGAAIGYARQTLAVTADVPYVLLVDLYAGSTKNWRVRLLDGADVEEHVSYYDKAGRVPIVHIPSSATLRLELGCNTAVSGDDVKFGGVRAARCLLVDNSLAVGNELKVKGGPASVDGAIKAGQFVTIRLWNGWQMVRLIEDFDTDASGNGTLKFGTALRAGVLGGGPVIVHAPFMRATLDAPVSESQLEPTNFRGLALDAIEDPGALAGEVPHDTDIIWHWDANSLGLAPTIGSGTPTMTRAAATATYVDGDGLIKVAAANAPRLNFDPVTKALRGLLAESARTNRIWPSQDITHANFATRDVTVTANVANNHMGQMQADRMVPTGAGSLKGKLFVASVVSGQRYALYAFVKKDGARYVVLDFSDLNVNNCHFEFDLDAANGDILEVNAGSTAMRTVAGSGFKHDFPDGWIMVGGVFLAGANVNHNAGLYILNANRDSVYVPYNGDGVSGILVGGLQLEDGSTPSSYIPTTTGPVARNADVDTLATNLIPGFTANEYTIVGEALLDFVETSAAVRRHVCSIDDGTANERAHVFVEAATARVDAAVIDGGVASAAFAGASIGAAAAHRFALGVKTNDFAYSQLGAAAQTDVTGTVPTPTTLRKACRYDNTEQANGYNRRLSIYKKKKPNRQVRSLSA